MIILPKKFEDGIKEYSSQYTPQNTNIIIIPNTSRNFNASPQQHYVTFLAKKGYDKNIYQYIPPPHVSPTYRTQRVEEIPHITRPEYGTILIDDSIESGKTIKFCIDRLAEQGLAEDSIWPMVGLIDAKNPKPNYPVTGTFLDRWHVYKSILETPQE